jgi:hypothetical protein
MVPLLPLPSASLRGTTLYHQERLRCLCILRKWCDYKSLLNSPMGLFLFAEDSQEKERLTVKHIRFEKGSGVEKQF